METLERIVATCSLKVRLTLVKADLFPQLINALNPLSLSFAEAIDIHTCLISTISWSLWFSIPYGLANLEITDRDEQQAVRETVLKQVLSPLEKYICHLCVNRYSILVGEQSYFFIDLLAKLLRICPYHHPTMDFVLNKSVILTIPSCLTFFEKEKQIWSFLDDMVDSQRQWNKQREQVLQLWKTVDRMLRMEGMDDVMEATLLNDKNTSSGQSVVAYSIELNNLQGMNLPELE
ncbi:hypothetical protein BLNAU_13393 [Blattamonas nauphoetae]|uniref:Uncharacterized protein n=1 Tax=Blattamonas nauphoetae TaxID=2049346 RepID=A0ABQ9XLE6_9EUKA|nr:hypothetical protein BLNAU_13393 [Blattamonas nauphoetae]